VIGGLLGWVFLSSVGVAPATFGQEGARPEDPQKKATKPASPPKPAATAAPAVTAPAAGSEEVGKKLDAMQTTLEKMQQTLAGSSGVSERLDKLEKTLDVLSGPAPRPPSPPARPASPPAARVAPGTRPTDADWLQDFLRIGPVRARAEVDQAKRAYMQALNDIDRCKNDRNLQVAEFGRASQVREDASRKWADRQHEFRTVADAPGSPDLVAATRKEREAYRAYVTAWKTCQDIRSRIVAIDARLQSLRQVASDRKTRWDRLNDHLFVVERVRGLAPSQVAAR
jgi:hypothetical protein